MPGISNRIVSFAKSYNQMKFLVIFVISSVKWFPGLWIIQSETCVIVFHFNLTFVMHAENVYRNKLFITVLYVHAYKL
jgi:hypothetical protein